MRKLLLEKFDDLLLYAASILGVAFTVYGMIAVLLMWQNKFTDTILYPVSMVAIIVTAIATGMLMRRIKVNMVASDSKERLLINSIAVVFLIVWVGVNAFYSFQTAFIKRDPGVYATEAVWLTKHSSTNIPVNNSLSFGIAGATQATSGVWADINKGGEGYLQPQGTHILSSILALFGKLGGLSLLYKANVIIGGIALLVFYVLARFYVRPRYALLGLMLLGACLPVIYFARDTYTEPLAMFFTLSLLLMFTVAYKLLRHKIDSKKVTFSLQDYGIWGLVGFLAGSTLLVRADGYLTFISLMPFFIVALLASKSKRPNPQHYTVIIKAFLVSIVAQLPAMVLAYIDLHEQASGYFQSQGSLIIKQIIAFFLGAIAVVVTGAVLRKRPDIRKNIIRRFKNKNMLRNMLVIVFLAVSLILYSRPLWMQAAEHNGNVAGAVQSVQQLTNEAIAPRTYAEHTINWLEWYMGGVCIVLVVIGIVAIINKTVLRLKIEYLIIALPAVLISLIYLWSPQITADQVWASRRFVPVVIPLLTLVSLIGLSYLEKSITKIGTQRKYITMAMVFISILFVIQPLMTTRPFIRTRESAGQVAAIEALCDRLPRNSLVIWAAENTLSNDAPQSVRAFCDVQSFGLSLGTDAGSISAETLKEIADRASAAQLQPYIAMHGNDLNLLIKDQEQKAAFSNVATYEGEYVGRTVAGPPTSVYSQTDSIELSTPQPDGKLSRL